jgi:hypothetical protein
MAMAAAPIAGDGAVSVEGVSCPDTVPATAIVTSSATEGDGSALSTSMGLASGASSPVGGISAILWRWGLGKEDEGRTSSNWGFVFSGGGVRSEGTGKTLTDCGVK